MAVVAARNQPGSSARRHAAGSEFCIELGLVNNMPDGALDRTERQFFKLLCAAAPDLLVRVSFYSLAGIARGDSGLAHLKRNSYRPASELPHSGLDALIVTGTEPRTSELNCEPYWGELAQLFDWVRHDGPPAVFSCLAAHAAVLHYDGIARRRLSEKRFGQFHHVVAGVDALTEHLSPALNVAHSRWNEVSESALAECGYRILTWSPEAGVDLFIKRARNDLLFCQGHPEYDPATLSREYHRDVRRFLARETDAYPSLPSNYFAPAEAVVLKRFRERAMRERSEELVSEFPVVARRPDGHWRPPAAPAFRAWLKQIVECKRRRRPCARVPSTPALVLAKAS